jgi:hypothetical protein
LSLRSEENKAELFLGQAYRQVFEFERQIQINQAALRAATAQLKAYKDLFQGGRGTSYGADLVLAIQNWSSSAANLYTSIVQYNNALATLDFARGSIRERDNVLIGEGPLPLCAQVRAVEHERQRTAAMVLRERSPASYDATCADSSELWATEALVPPRLGADSPKPLPRLLENRLPVPEMEKP